MLGYRFLLFDIDFFMLKLGYRFLLFDIPPDSVTRGLGDVPSYVKSIQKSSSQRTSPRERDRARATVR